MRIRFLLYSLLLFSLPWSGAHAAIQAVDKPMAGHTTESEFDSSVALKISQEAINNQLKEHEFIDADGKRVTLNDFRGKPLVLSMIYTSCYQICPMTTRHLSSVVEKARETLGGDSFSVAIIGFDAQFDTPDKMKSFADRQGISGKGWNLLSMAEEDVEALSKDIGFAYYPSSNGFDHIIQATIVDAGGKLYRQVYGQSFSTPLLVDPLIELVLGRPQAAQSHLSSLVTKIKLFCTTYDPVRDGYYFDYSLFLGMLIGASIILYTGFLVLRELYNNQKTA
jgi:protein SCO1/2